MTFKNFRLNIILQVLGLTLSICFTILFFIYSDYFFLPLLFGLISIVLVVLIIYTSEKNNKRLIRFFDAIDHADFTTEFSSAQQGKTFDELNRKFNQVIRRFKQTRMEQEEHYQYLLNVVEHISIGIVVYKRPDNVDLVNNAFKKILHIPRLERISDLDKVESDLGQSLLNLRSGESCLRSLFVEKELMRLAIYAREFRMRGEEYMLISMQNIHGELDENEIESWQKLTRVLTHEIMNSITPIASLASSMKEIVQREETESGGPITIVAEDADSLLDALVTIEKRSAGLMRFVETYRNLTRIPKPGFRHVSVRDLFNRVIHLLQNDLVQQGIQHECRLFPEQIMLTADPDLIDQVLINLVMNSMQALQGTTNPRIMLTAYEENGAVFVQVSDNGHGISPDVIDKIFIPFYTSRKDGSGIGLSLARQIMHLHKGSVYVRSVAGEETVFTLAF